MTLEQWHQDIHVIGAGGIGTHVVQAMLEMGANRIHLWDDDIVEAHNLPTQFLYRKDDIGSLKVEAAARFVEDRQFDTKLVPMGRRVDDKTELSGIVVSGVDSMASRQAIWQTVEYNAEIVLYIDCRIGGDIVQIHTVDPADEHDVERYRTWLMPDSEVRDLGCVTRQNPHSAMATGQAVSTYLTLFMRGELFQGFVERNLVTESVS